LIAFVVDRTPPRMTTFAGGFDFARRLRDPGLRAALRSAGWLPGRHVVIAADDEAVLELASLMVFHATGGHALIVVTDDTEPRRFRIMYAEVANESASVPVIELEAEPTSACSTHRGIRLAGTCRAHA
jgi:hypothetical protein